MAYEVFSGSVSLAEFFTASNVGGLFPQVYNPIPNPAGTIWAAPSIAHGGGDGNGSTEYGVDIFHSNSSGIFRADSVDTGTQLPNNIWWISDTEFWATIGTNGTLPYRFISGASGFNDLDTNSYGTSHSSFTEGRLSADRKWFVTFPGVTSTSNRDKIAVFSSASQTTPGRWDRISTIPAAGFEVHFGNGSDAEVSNIHITPNLSNATPNFDGRYIFVAAGEMQSSAGRVKVVEIAEDSSYIRNTRGSFGGDSGEGNATLFPRMGDGVLYYHTASNRVIVGSSRLTNFGNGALRTSGNEIRYFDSSSQGFFNHTVRADNAAGIGSYTDGTVITSSVRTMGAAFTNQHIDPNGSQDRIFFGSIGNGSGASCRNGVIQCLESGSSGWKLSVVGAHRGVSVGSPSFAITPAGILADNGYFTSSADPAGTSDASLEDSFSTTGTSRNTTADGVYAWRRLSGISANPSIADSVTETVGAGGGTVKAGGTENSPTITVTIGSGDLDGNTSLTAAVISDASIKAQNLTAIKKEAGSAGAHFVGDIVRLTPHGTEFNSAVQVQFELDSAPADLTIWKRDSHDGDYTQWYQLPSTYWSASGTTITINTTRFSEYAGLGGINVARTKLSNSQLATLTTTDLVASTSIQISGSTNSFKDRTVAADDLFLIEDKSNGTTYHVSASQMAEYFGGLVSVTASSDNSDMRVTFVSPSDNADIGLAVDAGLKYNPSTDMLKGVNLSGSGDLTIAGNATIDDNLVLTKGFVQIKASELNVTGGIKASSAISGSDDLTIAGSATVDDNLIVTKGYVQIKASELNVTGGIKASSAISGSSDLTIAGSATVDDNLIITKGYVQIKASELNVTGGIKASSAISGSGALSIGGATVLGETLTVNARSKASATDNSVLVEGTGQFKLTANELFRVTNNSNQDIFAARENGDIEFGGGSSTGIFLYDASTADIKLKNPSNTGETAILLNDGLNGGIISGSSNLLMGGQGVFKSALAVTGAIVGKSNISGSGNLLIGGNATVAGNLTINGTTTVIDSTHLAVKDALVLLSSGATGTPVNDQGFIFERGDSANAAMLWDESTDRFVFANVGTASAGATGNISFSAYPVSASTFHGDGSGLTGVGAEVVAAAKNDLDLQLTFASGAASAGSFFINSGSLMYNPSTNGLKASALEPTGSETFRLGRTGEHHRITLNSTALVLSTPSGTGQSVEYHNNGFKAGEIEVYTDSGEAHTMKMKTTARLALSGGLGTFISGNLGLRLDGPLSGSGNVTTAGTVLVNGTGGITASAGPISGSGILTVAGASTLSGRLLVRSTAGITASAGPISGSGVLTVAGASTLSGRLLVRSTAGITASAGAVSASLGFFTPSVITAKGLISGSGGLDIGGTADFGAAVNVDGALTVLGGANLGDSGADAIVVSGALDVGNQNTKFRSNQIELLNLDGMALDSNDSTHFLLVQDSDNNYVKKESVTDLIQHITGAAGTRGGLQVHQGKLHIVQKEESFMSSSLTGHAHTASLDGPVLSGSLMVFLNGLLQTRSGSANLGSGGNSIFDYRLDSYTAPTKVLMADALDSDDVLIVRYVQK